MADRENLIALLEKHEYQKHYPSTLASVLLTNGLVVREKGKWVWSEENECWVCSKCELSALNNYRGNSTASNFCPNCGAEMRGAINNGKV